jgi:hypothetical protein
MTRFRRLRRTPSRPLDLATAFRILGETPSWRELGLVAEALREAGVEVPFDEETRKLAAANGSSALVALDLHTALAYGIEALTGGPRKSRAAAAEPG